MVLPVGSHVNSGVGQGTFGGFYLWDPIVYNITTKGCKPWDPIGKTHRIYLD